MDFLCPMKLAGTDFRGQGVRSRAFWGIRVVCGLNLFEVGSARFGFQSFTMRWTSCWGCLYRFGCLCRCPVPGSFLYGVATGIVVVGKREAGEADRNGPQVEWLDPVDGCAVVGLDFVNFDGDGAIVGCVFGGRSRGGQGTGTVRAASVGVAA